MGNRTTHLGPTSDAAEVRLAAAEWVAGQHDPDRDRLIVVSLTKEPNREDWFAVILPDLDYEVHGGTWDEPKWAWMEHPWFAALSLTVEECEEGLRAS